MAGLDFRGLQAVVDSWLVDDLLVTRTNGAGDDVLDEETGVLIPGATSPPVYEGLGAVQPIGVELLEDPDVASIVDSTSATHRVLFPMSTLGTTDFRYDDVVEVTAVNGFTPDPAMLETRWKVVHPGKPSTWTVVRIVYLAELRSYPDAG